jgi:hypothetical protein
MCACDGHSKDIASEQNTRSRIRGDIELMDLKRKMSEIPANSSRPSHGESGEDE